jgi:hypothetical protein
MIRPNYPAKSDVIDVYVYVHRESAKAVCVSIDGSDGKSEWLPRSQIEFERDPKTLYCATVTLPEWLAKKAGLI